MRTTNCKIVCREIDELDIGQDLSSVAREHVQSCEHCRSFYDGRRELRLMLGSLETVAAPSDFDFRVRARLANSEVASSKGFFFGNRSWGIPAATVAMLALLLGGAFAFRSLITGDTNSAVAVQPENPPTERINPNAGKKETVAVSSGSNSTNGDDRAIKADDHKADANKEVKRPRSLSSSVAAQRTGSRLATRDFSSLGASVVKQDDPVSSLEAPPVFAVETSSEPLRVSLDYETGGSRTISLPTLSFGSQRAIAGNSSVVKTSTKGVW